MNSRKFKKIYIEITNICNLSCDFCMPDNRKKEYMKMEDFEYILEQIKPYTEYIYLHVKGEPLMHPNINQFIEIAYNKGFKVNITTNGTLIDKLQTKKIRQINYSMQSNKDVGDIRKTIKHLRKFIVDTDIYLSLRLWSDESKGNIKIKEMLLEEFAYLQNKLEITDKVKLDKNIFLSIENEFTWPDLENSENKNEGYCHALKDHIAILVDGTVVPCCLDHKGNIVLGNIYGQDIKEIIESDRFINMQSGFKNRVLVEKLCKKCNFANKF